MRNVAVAGVSLAVSFFLVHSAASADEWTGFYIGGGIGADAATTDANITSPDGSGEGASIDGFGGGDFGGTLKAGADLQVNPWLVVGAFATYDWSAIETSANFEATDFIDGISGDAKLLDLQRAWAVGGRLGLIVSPATLAYGLIGYTRAELSDPSATITASQTDFFTGDVITETNSVKLALPHFNGIVFGGGFEHRITSNVSLWGEYRQSRFSSQTIDVEGVPVELDPTIHVGRVGVSYRFGASTAESVAEPARARQWSGAYVGGGLGIDGIAGKAEAAAISGSTALVANAEGVGGGDIGGTLLAGYDMQAGQFVAGAFVAYDRSAHDISISASAGGEAASLDVPSLGNMWTFAARAGYLLTPDVLAYGLAGYTRVEFSDWGASFGTLSASTNTPTFSGYTLGFGFEKMVSDNISLRAEYRYAGLGAKSVGGAVSDEDSGETIDVDANIDPGIHAVRLMGTYRFTTH